MQEEWRPVVGYKGLYEISNQGQVRSVQRESVQVRSRLGTPNEPYTRTFPSNIIKPFSTKRNGLKVHLHKRIDGNQTDEYFYIDDLVRQTFGNERSQHKCTIQQ